MTHGGIEPPIQPWEGCVLTAWPMGRYYVSDIRQSANQLYRIAPAFASRNPDKIIRNPLVFLQKRLLTHVFVVPRDKKSFCKQACTRFLSVWHLLLSNKKNGCSDFKCQALFIHIQSWFPGKSAWTFLVQGLDRLVLLSWMHYCTYTQSLSTWSSSRGLTSFEWDILSWGGLHA